MKQVGSSNMPSDERARYSQYDYLLGRVDRWSMLDLDDLLLELERDPALTPAERKELLSRAYAVLWRRAQADMRPPAPDEDSSNP